jgi:hypothetical protein
MIKILHTKWIDILDNKGDSGKVADNNTGYSISNSSVVSACLNLSISDSNRAKIATPEIVAALKRTLQYFLDNLEMQTSRLVAVEMTRIQQVQQSKL